MPRILLLVSMLICCSGLVSFSQDETTERYLEIRGTSELDMQPLAMATVHLYEGVKDIQTVKTGSDGNFSFRLEINKEYTIEVEKQGLVAKRISFNTAMPVEEKGTWMNEFSIGLVKFCDGVDYSILKEPVDIVKFDPKRREFVSDREYVNRMRPRIESVLIRYNQCMMDKYDVAIKKGDQAFLQKNMKEAVASYQEASEIFPRETYPAKQINEINRQLGKEQKASEQAEKKEQINTEDNFNLAMAKASVAYTRKDYATAGKYYQEALAIKPGESVPRDRLQEIEIILTTKAAEEAKVREVENTYKQAVLKADSLMKAKNYQSAREQYARASVIKPGEGYPKAKSQEIDILEEANARAAENTRKVAADKEYQAMLTQADKLFKAKSYDEAKAAYGKALAIRPSDPYAAQRAKVVENTIIAEKQKALEDQTAKQYQEIIGSADQFLQAKDLIKAREAYTRALSLKPGDEYAQSRISTIDNLVAAEQAAKINATEEGYKSAVGAANTAITQKLYGQAIEFLKKALDIKPGDAFATKKITELNTIMDEQQKIREQEALKKNQYKESVAEADKLFNSGDLPVARNAYIAVLQIMPGDTYASQKISVIDDLIEAKAADKLRRIDSAYSSVMTIGVEMLARKDYDKARESFQGALKLKPGDQSASAKLRDTESLYSLEKEKISAQQAKKKEYNDLVTAADQQMIQKQYNDARKGYENALAIMPEDKLAREKIARIDKIVLALSQKVKTTTSSDAGKSNAKAAFQIRELNFKTVSEKQLYLDELKKKYPAGITLEKYHEQYKETFRYIIIRDNQAMDFRQIRFLTFNGFQYSVNGKPITQQYFLSQVKTRQGETFQEIEMQ